MFGGSILVPNSNSSISNNINQQRRRSNPCTTLFTKCARVLIPPACRRWIVHICTVWIHSIVWKVFIVFCTVVLLFGRPIQHLWVPKEGDIVFTILYTIALAIFTLDMICNTIADPLYFQFTPRCCRSKQQRRQQRQQQQQPDFNSWTCGIGSFLFWCDAFSTYCLIIQIPYIASWDVEMPALQMSLDAVGVPVRV
jgi:hypothetical protein